MLIAITDLNNNTIVDNTFIKVLIEKQFCYGVPLEIRVGIPIEVDKLKNGNVFNLLFDDIPPLTLTLLDSYSDYIDNKQFQFYSFIHTPFDKIVKNIFPINSSVFGVKFDRYIIGLKKQLFYFTQGLKKKGVILTLDNDYKVVNKHLMSASFDIQKIDKNFYSVKDIISNNYRKKSYYTFDNNQVLSVTKNTIDLPNFLPFHNSQDIQGLSNYLLPRFELFGEYSKYKIGDKILIDNIKGVVMEKESFTYLGKTKTHLIIGVSANA